MIVIRQRAVDFDQARREANAAATLLEIEGGSAAVVASKAFEDAEKHMDQEDGLQGDPFSGMTGERMDLDLLNKETGLKDCQ